MKRLLFSATVSLLLLTGCHQFGGGVRIDNRHHEAQNMPPAHAPAHGRRSQYHRYYYYPNAEFYFDIGRNVYFYLDSRGQWVFSAALPVHLHSYRHSHRVEIEMESDKPYSEHHHHKKKYKKQKEDKNKRHDKKDSRKNGKKKHDDRDGSLEYRDRYRY